MENMTFTIGATSKHRYKVEGGTNISQGNKDKTYKIQKGYRQYDVRINDMNGKDYSTIHEVDDILKESKDNEIPMAQTYDMNGNPT